ncbi:MAG: hypothetical protein EOP85_12700 [Verrucomicrobiaceae bacterium]|nr:MAG: hypothetical protein EOP85_12700 [Verrucomicrobiaceae bacterium]
MRITIEIPDAIAQRAITMATDRQMTLDELVVQGLEAVLSTSKVRVGGEAMKLFAAMDQLPEFSAENRFTRHEANTR